MHATDFLWVAMGGGAGSVCRWLVGKLVGERSSGPFPWGTFLINVSGAFAIAYLSVLFDVDWRDRYGHGLNSAVLTGFLGGYTTFSSLQLDALHLRQQGKTGLAAGYVIVSVGAGLLAAALGAWLATVQD